MTLSGSDQGDVALTVTCAIVAQTEWIRETIEEAHALAKQSNLDFSVEVYVTRTTGSADSGTSSPIDSPSLGSLDEKKEDDFGRALAGTFVDARQFSGRPDIAETISHVVSESAGCSLVIGESCVQSCPRRLRAHWFRLVFLR